VAVALRLGCSVCIAHTCRCGAVADAQELHGLVCKQAPSETVRHQAIKVHCPCHYHSRQPSNLVVSGLMTPWQGSKSLTWDVIVVSTLADFYLRASSLAAGSTAEITSVRKE